MSQSISLTDRPRLFAPYPAPRADARPAPAADHDGLLAGVVERARGALGWMRSVARAADAPAQCCRGDLERRDVQRRDVQRRDAREVEVLIARAREVADGRAALAAPELGAVCDCPDCGAPVGRARYCPECGRGVALVRSCRMCEAELPGTSRFCLECGAQA